MEIWDSTPLQSLGAIIRLARIRLTSPKDVSRTVCNNGEVENMARYVPVVASPNCVLEVHVLVLQQMSTGIFREPFEVIAYLGGTHRL